MPTTDRPDADTLPLPDAPPGDTTPVTTKTVRRITILPNKVSGTHMDFPVLFTASITSAHPMGFDIFFSEDQAGAVRWAHEVERYQPNELVAWVKVPSLSQATQLYLHYGDTTITTSQENRAAVWSASYAAVWHLSSLDDATGKNPLVASGGSSVTGQIASARGFNGTGNVLNAGSDASLDNIFAGGGTIEAWFSATTAGQGQFGRIFDKGGTGLGMCAGNGGGNDAVLFARDFSVGNGIWCTEQDSITLGQWTYVAVSYDEGSTANTPAFFINGNAAMVGISDTPIGTVSSDAVSSQMLGDQPAGGRGFNGQIDEARFSTVRRSAEWIRTSYENQRDPAMFFQLSGPL